MARQSKQDSKRPSGSSGQATNESEALRHLCQTEMAEQFPDCFFPGEWTILYCYSRAETSWIDISSALVEPAAIPKALRNCDPDIDIEHCPIMAFTGYKELYQKPGLDRGFRPIVRLHSFVESHRQHLELTEDFRLCYNLFQEFCSDDMTSSNLLEIDSSGRRTLVAQITPDCVRVQSSYLDGFLESSGLCLALHVRSLRFSGMDLSAVDPKHRNRGKSDCTTRWRLRVQKYGGPGDFSSSSWLGGKKILHPSGTRKTEQHYPKIGRLPTRPKNTTGLALSPKTLEDLHAQFPVTEDMGWQLISANKVGYQCGFILSSALARPYVSQNIIKEDAVWSPFTASQLRTIISAETEQADEGGSELHEISDGLLPLVMCRTYPDSTLDHGEVVEEFRLHYNLVLGPDRRTLHTFDRSGRPVAVVRFDNSSVEVRRRHLCEFLRVADYHLVVFFESIQRAHESGEAMQSVRQSDQDPGVYEKRILIQTSEIGGDRFQTTHGKAVVYPPCSDENTPHDIKRPEVSFILGLDKFGREIEETSTHWATKDGERRTMIHFRGPVLDKYYRYRENYKIKRGGILCHRRWYLQIFNFGTCVRVHHDDLVGLPIDEQHHWRSYNISPADVKELGELREMPPIERFLIYYSSLNEKWNTEHGWHLFTVLDEEDQHIFGELERPIATQGEFDGHLNNIAKLLCEAPNFDRMASMADEAGYGVAKREFDPQSAPKGAKQKKRDTNWRLWSNRKRAYEDFLQSFAVHEWESAIEFLDLVWNIRSKGSAHLKGPEYKEILRKRDLKPQENPQEAFDLVIEEGIGVLLSLEYYLFLPREKDPAQKG